MPPVDTEFYERLGVPHDADEAAIKKAYKMMALKWHPDKHMSADENARREAEEKFKGISEAFGVLSDPEKRSQYDECGKNFEEDHGDDDFIDPFELFQFIFAGRRGGRGAGFPFGGGMFGGPMGGMGFPFGGAFFAGGPRSGPRSRYRNKGRSSHAHSHSHGRGRCGCHHHYDDDSDEWESEDEYTDESSEDPTPRQRGPPPPKNLDIDASDAGEGMFRVGEYRVRVGDSNVKRYDIPNVSSYAPGSIQPDSLEGWALGMENPNVGAAEKKKNKKKKKLQPRKPFKTEFAGSFTVLELEVDEGKAKQQQQQRAAGGPPPRGKVVAEVRMPAGGSGAIRLLLFQLSLWIDRKAVDKEPVDVITLACSGDTSGLILWVDVWDSVSLEGFPLIPLRFVFCSDLQRMLKDLGEEEPFEWADKKRIAFKNGRKGDILGLVEILKTNSSKLDAKFKDVRKAEDKMSALKKVLGEIGSGSWGVSFLYPLPPPGASVDGKMRTDRQIEEEAERIDAPAEQPKSSGKKKKNQRRGKKNRGGGQAEEEEAVEEDEEESEKENSNNGDPKGKGGRGGPKGKEGAGVKQFSVKEDEEETAAVGEEDDDDEDEEDESSNSRPLTSFSTSSSKATFNPAHTTPTPPPSSQQPPRAPTTQTPPEASTKNKNKKKKGNQQNTAPQKTIPPQPPQQPAPTNQQKQKQTPPAPTFQPQPKQQQQPPAQAKKPQTQPPAPQTKQPEPVPKKMPAQAKPAPPKPSADPQVIAEIHEILPQIPKERIAEALASSGGSTESTMETLLLEVEAIEAMRIARAAEPNSDDQWEQANRANKSGQKEKGSSSNAEKTTTSAPPPPAPPATPFHPTPPKTTPKKDPPASSAINPPQVSGSQQQNTERFSTPSQPQPYAAPQSQNTSHQRPQAPVWSPSDFPSSQQNHGGLTGSAPRPMQEQHRQRAPHGLPEQGQPYRPTPQQQQQREREWEREWERESFKPQEGRERERGGGDGMASSGLPPSNQGGRTEQRDFFDARVPFSPQEQVPPFFDTRKGFSGPQTKPNQGGPMRAERDFFERPNAFGGPQGFRPESRQQGSSAGAPERPPSFFDGAPQFGPSSGHRLPAQQQDARQGGSSAFAPSGPPFRGESGGGRPQPPRGNFGNSGPQGDEFGQQGDKQVPPFGFQGGAGGMGPRGSDYLYGSGGRGPRGSDYLQKQQQQQQRGPGGGGMGPRGSDYLRHHGGGPGQDGFAPRGGMGHHGGMSNGGGGGSFNRYDGGNRGMPGSERGGGFPPQAQQQQQQAQSRARQAPGLGAALKSTAGNASELLAELQAAWQSTE
uniref:J domain-containing protein n=1 Tax=Chromera velia CCMP2878 TaxID=1169474 RepID=A0A0G4GFW4_9ALVE|eukprot:Cvel_4646.t1-p1 / transcript=Cvel_4646.t1 / gene=Cvel_4646 / organism=Chromera_velia_CCMP2878 / gene_product=DnaJ homolog subfamily B member 3, putative / transcript_product=DnaJ homolog subfamily B member 3, putative / location=Cvel_scaffold205:28586-33740(+) / protein_length=1310 / sequence_SO=supercontig / SO=protein_coding / is_pseudo=false